MVGYEFVGVDAVCGEVPADVIEAGPVGYDMATGEKIRGSVVVHVHRTRLNNRSRRSGLRIDAYSTASETKSVLG